MSMIGNYVRVTEDVLNELLDGPEGLSSIIYPEDETSEWVERRPDIDKSWHIIHFLLNGKPWDGVVPFMFVVLGGDTVSAEDVGYGPARFIDPAQVKQVASALQTVSSQDLLQRWDQEAIDHAEIYPEGWTRSAEEFEYIGGNYEELRKFFLAAATNSEAVLEWIS
jgi:hypothetical protein